MELPKKLTIKTFLETDGRYYAVIEGISGMVAYGETQVQAIQNVVKLLEKIPSKK